MEDNKVHSHKMKRDESEDSEFLSSAEERRRSKGRRGDREHKKKSKDEGQRKEKRKRRKKKQCSSSDDDGKKSKKRRKKRQHTSNSESSSDDDKEERSKKRRLLKEAKRIIKSHKRDRNGANGVPSSHKKVLSEEDYYEKNKEFSTWLKEERGVYFADLSSDDTRRLFADFVQEWNAGKLSVKLYNGIHSAARTDHKWQFKGEHEYSIDKEEEMEFIKSMEKSQRRKFHKEHNDLMDELLPKATGRDRLFEKRSIRKEEARQRLESPELLRDHDIMGGGEDFKQRLQKERARREKKAAERNDALKEKRLALEQKEDAAMDQFKALVNFAGGKITIPKRIE